MAPLTVAPLAAELVSVYDWRTSQLLIGMTVWVLLLPAALLIRRAPALQGGGGARGMADAPVSAGGGVALAAIRGAGGHVFRLLCDAFGAAVPYGELRDFLRSSCHGGGVDLQRGRLGGD